MKSSLAHKLAEEFINVLKYNPDLTHDEKILSLELRLDKLISDVEKGCEEAQKRREVEQQKPLSLDPRVDYGPAIVSESPNEREVAFGQVVKQRGPAN